MKENCKTRQVQSPGDLDQLDVESEDKIVPVVIGMLGTIKMQLDQNLQLVPGHPSATELQRITLMSTAHSICKVLGEIPLICCWDMDVLEYCHLITNR